MSSFIDFLRNTAQNTARDSATNLASTFPGFSNARNAFGTAQSIGNMLELIQGLGGITTMGPLAPAPMPTQVNAYPGMPTGSNKKKRPTSSKTDTSKMTSQQVQGLQETHSRPTNSASPGGGGTRRGNDKLARQQFPRAMAQARAQGAPGVTNLIGSILNGQIDPDLALARGWITPGQHQSIRNQIDDTPARVNPRGQASRNQTTGVNPAQMSPGQRTVNQPQQGTMRPVPQQNQAQPPAGPSTGSDRINRVADSGQQTLSDLVQYLRGNNLATPDTKLSDIPDELVQGFLENRPQPAQTQNQPTPAPQGQIQRPTQQGMTLSPVETQQFMGGSESERQQGMATLLTRLGVSEHDPAYGWMLENADNVINSYYMLTADTGGYNPDMTNLPDFVYDQYLDLHGAGGPQQTPTLTLLDQQINSLMSDPNSQIRAVYDGMVEQTGDPAAVLWRFFLDPVLSQPQVSPMLRDGVASQLTSYETQYNASGFQGSFPDYLAQSGFDPLSTLR